MNRTFLLCGVLAVTVMLTQAPALAHHSAAMFDTSAEITLKGTVAEWAWSNPHCTLRIDVKGKDGTVTRWAVATSNIADLSKRGWSRRTFTVGEEVTVLAQPAKSGEPVGMIKTVVMADGKTLP
jgi:hypothetical protein